VNQALDCKSKTKFDRKDTSSWAPKPITKEEMDEVIVVKLENEMVDVFCVLDNQYDSYVILEKNKRVLYLRLDKALYGCIRAALLWYELFSGTLQKLGYSINPYDICVANKVIDGQQCTIRWYVDDDIIVHKDHNVVRREIAHIEKHFGTMSKVHGSKHSFVGINIEFSGDGAVIIDTNKYFREVIEDFQREGNVIVGTNANPAAPNIFNTTRKNTPLSVELGDVFRCTVAKLLWAGFIIRRYILCSRLNCATESDWEKLRRILGYLKWTIHTKRKLSVTYTLCTRGSTHPMQSTQICAVIQAGHFRSELGHST